MCGIAGFTSTKNIDNQILYDMIEEIKHRGPDAKGIYVNKNVKFAHRRLIVIDPEGGVQPMVCKKNQILSSFIMVKFIMHPKSKKN